MLERKKNGTRHADWPCNSVSKHSVLNVWLNIVNWTSVYISASSQNSNKMTVRNKNSINPETTQREIPTKFCKMKCQCVNADLEKQRKLKSNWNQTACQGGWCKVGGGIDGSFCYRILEAGVPDAVLHQKQGVEECSISKGERERTPWNPRNRV